MPSPAWCVRRAGRIEWRGEAIFGEPAYAIVSKGLALSPEGWRLFVGQTVEQNLRLGATALADRSRIDALFERVYALFPRLAERRRQSAGTLSGGERQMLALGRALMSEPQLADARRAEPRPRARRGRTALRHAVELHRQGLTLLLAEQSIPLALGIADYAYVLQTGRIALEGPAAELERNEQVQEIYLGVSRRRHPDAAKRRAESEAIVNMDSGAASLARNDGSATALLPQRLEPMAERLGPLGEQAMARCARRVAPARRSVRRRPASSASANAPAADAVR